MVVKRHRIAPDHLDRARDLRRESTFPERLLWSRLRKKQLGGLKFRRQQPVGRFIVDFCCPSRKLVVELDGLSHVGRGQYDEDRSAELETLGFRVIRITNDDVVRDIDAVIEMIARDAEVVL